ncbi:MAG TPA: SNF2-related protein [Pyrinomonadaceae bacterium]
MPLTPCASSARGVFEHRLGTESNRPDNARFAGGKVSLEEQPLTPYHAKYFAWELTKRCAPGDVQRLTATLLDAQVDINPHQIDAALFAFRSPLLKGALLADEVGLGKTIEAGIVLSQKWAAGNRKLLVIVPANLRKQWHQELAEKFFLPAVILETRSFNEQIESSMQLNPFDQGSAIVVCSYQFARAKEQFIKSVAWDLVVLDEAHRLRNVYKPGNRIANAIKNAVSDAPKLLLTATPLQNSLLELFGLISFIDEYIFGDLRSFKSRFSQLSSPADVAELRSRLEPVCQRTLRQQVLEYVPFTRRFALVQEFYPSAEESRLYDLVSQYLQRPELMALEAGQRTLMTLVLRKLLASSSHAIAGTLAALVCRVERMVEGGKSDNVEMLTTDVDTFDEIKEEWNGNDAQTSENSEVAKPLNLQALNEELKLLRELRDLASSIRTNSKGEVLLTALGRGLAEALQRGAAKKAVIFTESTRTQRYVSELLEASDYAGKVVLFNGSNNDEKSKSIYRAWLKKHENSDHLTGSASADMRAALVEYFRDEGEILIATEAAAEGINLQFCSLVVNYDLPWNPQRIEQRIGRCHRYGQKSDVVVVNFLNKENAADQRVYQLLDEKFKLFNGVFGSSDEVLGTIESGLDFEKRIAAIYGRCRTLTEIEADFKLLQVELET